MQWRKNASNRKTENYGKICRSLKCKNCLLRWGNHIHNKQKITNKRTPFPNCNRYFILIFEVTRAFLSAHQTINIYVYFADRIPTYSNSIQPSIRTMICNNKKKRWSEHLSMITYKFIPRIFLKIYTHKKVQSILHGMLQSIWLRWNAHRPFMGKQKCTSHFSPEACLMTADIGHQNRKHRCTTICGCHSLDYHWLHFTSSVAFDSEGKKFCGRCVTRQKSKWIHQKTITQGSRLEFEWEPTDKCSVA